MKICYIQEENSTNNRWELLGLKLKFFFNIIKIKYIDEKLICILPFHNDLIISEKKKMKLAKKLNKVLLNNTVSNIVFSIYLEELKLHKYIQINVLNGITLFNYLIDTSVEYIAEKQQKRIEEIELSFLVNQNTDLHTHNILLLAQKVKMLNIVTDNIQKFKKIETYLYDELGIMIKVSNNKRKAIIKTDIIINVDFSDEMISKYIIPNDCIIININENIIIKSKRFNGININNYEIEIPEKYRMNRFRDEVIYESIIYGKGNFDTIKNHIKQDEVKVIGLIGKNGKINEQEFVKN